jgi:tetratricopeptide (TPR) repeat protein
MSPAPPTVSPPEPALQQAARRLAEGRPDEAVALLDALVRDAPIYAAAHVLFATALGAAGRTRASLDAWNQAAVLVPRSPVVQRERQKILDLLATLPAATPEPPPTTFAEPQDVDPVPVSQPSHDHVAEAPGADDPAPGSHTLGLEELVGTPAAPVEPLPADTPADPPPAMEAEAVQAPVEWAEPAPPALDVLPPEPPTRAPHEAADDGVAEGWALLDEEIAAHTAPAVDASAALLPPEGEAPAAAASAPSGFSVSDELDLLISQLEDAPRIRPDPAYSGPTVSLDDSGVDDLASETLARIYAAQNQFAQAALIYEKLAAQQPEQADAYLERAAEMRSRRG